MAYSHFFLRFTLVASLAALTVASGCLPDANSNQTLGPAPVVDTDAPDAETAYWRDQYRKNRTVPPKVLAVAPKPARNNEFGEFEDDLYASLDAQPALPGLPGGQDIMPMMGGPASYPTPAALSPQTRVGASDTVSGVRSVSRSVGGASALEGITSDARFYPIEQLVFGGDYPDMDKPELYRLMPKDVVSLTVKDHPEFSGKLDIQPDGTVRVPNTPDFITLRGMTVDEAAETLRLALQVYVRGECVVRVQTNRARGGYYFVFGDVNQPGRFPMGLEPVKLSDAVLAANWEANPNRMREEDELGPAFPAAGPRGTFNAPASADLARVMLITPHRSQPLQTTHDIRSAMLGMTGNDPAVRPGQIIVVPSLDPRRNASLGLAAPAEGAAVPDALMPGQGFSNAGASARLPYVNPETHPRRRADTFPVSEVESNMAGAFAVQANTAPIHPEEEIWYDADAYCEIPADYGAAATETQDVPKAAAKIEEQATPTPESPAPEPEAFEETRTMAGPPASDMRTRGRKLPRGSVEGIAEEAGKAPVPDKPRRRRGRKLKSPTPIFEEYAPSAGGAGKRRVDGWDMGF